MLTEKVYPIGTVVRIAGQQERYMITGFLRTMKDGRLLDYAAVRFPLGNIGPAAFRYFEHESVSEVLFEGYRNDDHEKLEKLLCQGQEKIRAALKARSEAQAKREEVTELE